MKKLSLILLVFALILVTFSTTSCEAQNTSELSFFDQAMLFIYGESDAADYFMNFELFSGTRSMVYAFAKVGQTVGQVFSNLWNQGILYAILASVLAVILAIVAYFAVTILFGIMVGFDIVIAMYTVMSFLVFGALRCVLYIFVDLGLIDAFV